jgi:hypothetical protein
MSSNKNHFLVIDEVKMRSKKSAEISKRKNDKAIASDSKLMRRATPHQKNYSCKEINVRGKKDHRT